jgi:hypothetical protein
MLRQCFIQVEAMFLKMSTGSGAEFIQFNVGNTVSKTDLRAAFEKDTAGKQVRQFGWKQHWPPFLRLLVHLSPPPFSFSSTGRLQLRRFLQPL